MRQTKKNSILSKRKTKNFQSSLVRILLIVHPDSQKHAKILAKQAKSLGVEVYQEYSEQLDMIVSDANHAGQAMQWLRERTGMFYEALTPNIRIVHLKWLQQTVKRARIQNGRLYPLAAAPRKKVYKSQFAATTNENFIIARYACQRKHALKHKNSFLTDNLEVMAQCYRLQGHYQDNYRVLAYEKAIASLKALPEKVQSPDELTETIDIGPEMLRILTELLETGKCEKIDKIRKAQWFKTMTLFTKIRFVGPSQALQWLKAGCFTIKDVFNMARKEPKILRQDPRIFAGLMFFKDLSELEVTKEIATQIVKTIRRALRLHYESELDQFHIEVITFRRGKSSSSSIEILFSHPDERIRKQAVKQLCISLFNANYLLYSNFNQLQNIQKISPSTSEKMIQNKPSLNEQESKIKSRIKKKDISLSRSKSRKMSQKETKLSSKSSNINKKTFSRPKRQTQISSSNNRQSSSKSRSLKDQEKTKKRSNRSRSTSSNGKLKKKFKSNDSNTKIKSRSASSSKSKASSQTRSRSSTKERRSRGQNVVTLNNIQIAENVIHLIVKLPTDSRLTIQDGVKHPVNEFAYNQNHKPTLIPFGALNEIFRNRNWVAVHVDLITFPLRELPFQKLNWTGNRLFIRSMRLYAKREKNAILNQQSLRTSNGRKVTCDSEQDIFAQLDLTYIKPEFRNP